MNNSIVLLGPIAVGKTTVAKKLSKKLNMPYVSYDLIKLNFFKEVGFSEDIKQKIVGKLGWKGVYRYYCLFNPYAVSKVLHQFNNCIIELGGCSTMCEQVNQKQIIKKAIAEVENSFLLMPYPCAKKTIKFLNSRTNWKNNENLNQEIVNNLFFNNFSKNIVYTKKYSPDVICQKIINKINIPSN